MNMKLNLRRNLTGLAIGVSALGLLAGCEVASTGSLTAASSNGIAAGTESHDPLQNNALLYSENCLTEAEVVEAQEAWGRGIVKIGQVYQQKGDYVQAAKDHIQMFYGYDLGSVLFKPTLAAQKQFRNSFDSALSYFVGGNASYPEDKGFAIKPWSDVRWENAGIINNNCKMAVAMGNYYFTPSDGNAEVKVEYTFAYVKDRNDHLKIAVHQSSIPFQSGK